MLPPRRVRRLVFVPLVIVIAAALSRARAAAGPLQRRFRAIRQSRPAARTGRGVCGWRVSPSPGSSAETAALTVSGCLWIVSGFGGRLDTEPYRARNYAVMRWFLDLIYRAARAAPAG